MCKTLCASRGKTLFAKPTHVQETNITNQSQKTQYENTDWINMAQDKYQHPELVSLSFHKHFGLLSCNAMKIGIAVTTSNPVSSYLHRSTDI
jgi:hypothetical protein